MGELLPNVSHMKSGQSPVLPRASVVVITGNYGSGKTEVSVNWAIQLARAGLAVTIADLDVVNPYFRCREATEAMTQAGIRVVAPDGELHHAELPIILPEVKGIIEQPKGLTMLDVGGDEDGARVLASLNASFAVQPYEMLQVVNQRRPFTDTLEGCLKIQAEIEAASRLQMTGLISNAHLMDETDPDVILDGVRFARELGQGRGQDLRFVTVPDWLASLVDLEELGCPAMVLERHLLPPWRAKGDKLGCANFKLC